MEKQGITSIQMIPAEEFENLRNEIKEIKSLFQQQKIENIANLRYTKAETRKILKISQKTMDNYLSRGVLPFSQFGAKIYIKATDLEAFFQRYYVKKN
jgi:cobalamin biosynthesis Co2+ chelatase CbiK